VPRLPVIALAVVACTACGSSTAIRLRVVPQSSLLDQPLSIRVSGAKPGAILTISARENGWTAHAVYRVPRDGTIDVARAPSLGGSFTGRHPMGLLWSMRAAAAAPGPTPLDGGSLQVEVTQGSRDLTSTLVTRRAATPGLQTRTLDVARDRLFGSYFTLPPDGRRHPAVLIFGGSEGGLSVAPDAKMLASHGLPTLALAYFAEPGLPPELGRIPLEYFARALRWLDRQPGVDPRRVVVYGESRGSEAALLLGVHYPALVHGVVGIVPSSEVEPGNVTSGANVPAWTFRGKAVPFTGVRANIPVERIRGPILVAGGGLDLVWPSATHARDIAERSRARHGPAVVVYDYPFAGHFGYAVPYLPSSDGFSVGGVRHRIGGTTAANAEARADLWPRILRFLRRVPEANR
jgi:dienelactone hydrolase